MYFDAFVFLVIQRVMNCRRLFIFFPRICIFPYFTVISQMCSIIFFPCVGMSVENLHIFIRQDVFSPHLVTTIKSPLLIISIFSAVVNMMQIYRLIHSVSQNAPGKPALDSHFYIDYLVCFCTAYDIRQCQRTLYNLKFVFVFCLYVIISSLHHNYTKFLGS